jgi:hypothetical protein
MNWKVVLSIGLICAVLCLSLALFTQEAQAQDSNDAKNSDQKVAQRRGISGSLAPPEDDEDGDGVTPTQMWLGLGSCVVMWIVVKYL